MSHRSLRIRRSGSGRTERRQHRAAQHCSPPNFRVMLCYVMLQTTVFSRELGHLDVVGLVAAVLLASTGIALVAEDGASGHPAGLCIAAAAHRDHRGLLGCAAIVSCCSCSTGICNLGFVVLLPHSSTTGRPSIVAAYTAGPTAAPRRPPTPLQIIGLRSRPRSRPPTGLRHARAAACDGWARAVRATRRGRARGHGLQCRPRCEHRRGRQLQVRCYLQVQLLRSWFIKGGLCCCC